MNDGSGINRRKFVRNAGATAAGIAVMAVGAEAFLEGPASEAVAELPITALDPGGLLKPGVPKGNVLEGDIVSIGPQRLVIHPVESAPITVELTPNANISREGSVPLSAYSPGDEVVVLGDRSGDKFTAVGVAAVFRTVEATLYSRQGNALNTSEGEIVLTPNSAPKGWVSRGRRVEPRPLAKLKPGDKIIVMGLVNQKSKVMTAGWIGVLSSGGDPLLGP